MNGIKLKVAEAHQDDVNKGIVRVDSSIIRSLGVNIGDIIGIKGERETVGVVERAYPSDLGLEIIRMDGTMRKNAKIGIGESVTIFKAQIQEATKVTLAPMQEFVMHPATLANLKKSLYKKAFCQGDIITIGSNPVERRTSFGAGNPFAIDLFNAIENEFLGFNQGSMKFKVVNAKPTKEFLYISQHTQIEITSQEGEEEESSVNYEDIGGLKSHIEKIRELVELPLKHPELFTKLGIEPPKGILLNGPPGTGKTLLARAIASETEATFFSISAPEIVNKFYGESEKKLRELFENAQKESPAVIFIDEIDAIAQKREEVQGEVEKRIVAQLLTLMDGLKKSNKLIVIAATNRPDSLDEALRRPGRFDRELEIGVPKEEDRLEILQIHTRGMPIEIPKEFSKYESQLNAFLKKYPDITLNINEIKQAFVEDSMKGLLQLPEEVVEKIRKKESAKLLKEMASVTHGFVGADLGALVKEAAFNVLRRTFPEFNLGEEEEIPQEVLQKLEITHDDFTQALKVIRPSAMRELLVEVPNVKWEDIGGLDLIKQQMIEMVEWPLTNTEAFKRLGVNAPKGILMYGPPGTGKTLLAKAVATQTSCNFIYIKGPEIINKYVGESEKTIRKIFEKARQNSPSIVFFDEFDAIAGTRMGRSQNGGSTDTIVNQILTELDGLEELMNVKVIAATNRPKFIDPALLRPGRFDKLVLVDVPDEKARESILQVHCKDVPMQEKQEIITTIAQKTHGYVGADLEAVVREAGLIALRENVKAKEIKKEHFTKALEVIKPSVTEELQKFYSEVEQEMKNPKKMQESLSMSSYM
ncbi:MAG: CDC48 family AAA ATPase [Candidatus Nanoarchaeia archaeon]